MSAKVRPGGGSGWVAICKECQWASLTGPAFQVDFWADLHNADNHKETS